MGTNSKIQWCTHTLNFWRGCSAKMSPGCDHCYMHRDRFIKQPSIPTLTGKATWRQPLVKPRGSGAFLPEYKWRSGDKVFVNSCSDFFDEGEIDNWNMNDWRLDALNVIRKRPDLIWMILTKRSEVMENFVGRNGKWFTPNVWLGVTVENQDYTDRIKNLINIRCGKRFVSVEPMLGPVDLSKYLPYIDWVIIGGESGKNRRTIDYKHAKNLIDQCKDFNVPVFLKQWDFGGGLEKAPMIGRENYMEFPK